ncbi:hypothetical protein GCM10010452_41060 [Crossiella cryophila]
MTTRTGPRTPGMWCTAVGGAATAGVSPAPAVTSTSPTSKNRLTTSPLADACPTTLPQVDQEGE